MRFILLCSAFVCFCACGGKAESEAPSQQVKQPQNISLKQSGPLGLSSELSRASDDQLQLNVSLRSAKDLHAVHVVLVNAEQLGLDKNTAWLFEDLAAQTSESFDILVGSELQQDYALLRIDYRIKDAKRQLTKRFSLISKSEQSQQAQKPQNKQRELKLMPAAKQK